MNTDESLALSSIISTRTIIHLNQDDAMEESNGREVKLTSSWVKRLGMLFPGNVANLKDEMLQPHGDSSSEPTRRLTIEDVQDALRNMTSETMSVRSNASSKDPPSILKSKRVYSPVPSVDTKMKPNEEAPNNTNNTVYMLRLLMMVDSFPVDDRVNLGLPATDRLPNTLSFKPDPSSQIVAATNPHVNNMQASKVKEEERGGEGEDCDQPLGGLLRAKNEGQPQTSLTAILTYKPRRACSPNNTEENVSTSSEPLSSPAKALQTLEALASRASNQSSYTHPTTATDCDSQSQPSVSTKGESNSLDQALESTMLKYKPKRKNSPPSNMSGLTAQEVFGSFTTMNSTGTFRDTQKRCVPTLANRSNGQINQKNRNDSWRKLKGKSSRINDSSTLKNTLKSSDDFPSTGTFRDSAKRHVRTISEPNQQWDIKPLSQPVMPSSRTASNPGPSGRPDSVSELLNGNLLPSTGTFKDSDKRHVRLKSNEEWDLKQNQTHVRNFSAPDPFGYNPSTNTGSNGDMRVKSTQNQPEKPKFLFQIYMENKAKLESVQQKPTAVSVEHVASIPPKAVEATKPAAKGELLVDWGDQGSDSESEDEEQEENNGVITIIKNDSSRRISDITTQDDFDDMDEAFDTSLEMRERIRSLSIPEEPSWFELNPIQSNEGQNENDDYFLAGKDEDVGTGEAHQTILQRSESEKTSASSETVKTSGKVSTQYDNIIVETNINHVEMGEGLIRNMSAITLLELSDEEL